MTKFEKCAVQVSKAKNPKQCNTIEGPLGSKWGKVKVKGKGKGKVMQRIE